MAKKSGDPADPQEPAKKEKRVLTEEEQKTRKLLIVMGVLAVITACIYVPPLFTGGNKPQLAEAPTAPAPSDETGAPATPPEADPAAQPPADEAGQPGEGAEGEKAPPKQIRINAPLRFRPDPMQPFYTNPIAPDPTPTPIPQVVIPAPRPAVVLPALQRNPEASRAIVDLPRPRISSMADTVVPRASFPPKRRVGDAGSSGDPLPSYNKRLSGIIVGDGIRALLEIENGTEITTRFVQPGDVVDGITILSIKRQSEGNRTITRMVVRENGEERFVDLKPAPQQQANQNQPAP